MSLGSKHKNNQMKTDVMNNDTETVESYSEMKLMRVTFDEHLNFSRHIGEVCKNASRKVSVLMRLRNMLTHWLTTSAKLKIFNSFIIPGGGGTPYNGPYGEAPPERGTFFRLQVSLFQALGS